MQRDRDKQAKAAAKRDRRLVETIHSEFDAGVIDFETFEEKKTALLSRLSVD